MVIRKASKKDAKRILELLNSDKALTGNDDLSYLPRHVDEYINGKSCETFVYEENGKIIGLITVNLFRLGKYAELYIIVVDNNYRNKGVGSKLINFAGDYLKKISIDFSYFYTLENNISMQKLGEKYSYKKGKKHYFYSKGELRWKKQLYLILELWSVFQ